MKIAICRPFLQSDLWQKRLQRAAPAHRLESLLTRILGPPGRASP